MSKNDVRFVLVFTAIFAGMIFGFIWSINTYSDMVSARMLAAQKAAERVCYLEVAKVDGTNIPLAQAREEAPAVPVMDTAKAKAIGILADYQARLILAGKKLEDVRLAKMLAGSLVTENDAYSYIGLNRLIWQDERDYRWAIQYANLSDEQREIIRNNVSDLLSKLLIAYDELFHNELFPYDAATTPPEPTSEAMTAADMTAEPVVVPLLNAKDIAIVADIAIYGADCVTNEGRLVEASRDFAGSNQILSDKAWDDAAEIYLADKFAKCELLMDLNRSTIPGPLKEGLTAAIENASGKVAGLALDIRDQFTTPRTAVRTLTFENIKMFTSL